MDGFSMGKLPKSVRDMLRNMPDEHTARLGHEAQMAESAAFWSSLDPDQMLYVTKMLRRIIDSDDPSIKAANYYGNAEILLHLNHGRCLCGDPHSDPDVLLKELVLKSKEYQAESEACEMLNLRRVEAHDMNGDSTVAYACLNCGNVWESLEARKKASADSTICPGCDITI